MSHSHLEVGLMAFWECIIISQINRVKLLALQPTDRERINRKIRLDKQRELH